MAAQRITRTAATAPRAFQVKLLNRSIDTRAASASGFPAPLRVDDLAALQNILRQQDAPRDVYPIIIQFDGAIQSAWKADLAAAGCILRGYLPENAYLVECGLSALNTVTRHVHVQWAGAFLPEDRLSPDLPAITNPAQQITVTLQTLAPEDMPHAAQRINRHRGTIRAMTRGRRWSLLRADVAAGDLPALAQSAAVQWIEPYAERKLLNNVAVQGPRMNVTNVWEAHGLTGAGQVIGHADSGLDIGSTNGIHPDFAGRIKVAFALGRPGDWSDPNGHGTHTAGSVLGSGAAGTNLYRGPSYEALLVHQSVMDSGGGLGGLPLDLNDLFHPTYTNGARIHSDSWGSSVYGAYTADSRASDEFTWDHKDMLVVTSAGNSGYDGNNNGVVDTDSMGSPGTAKNILSVGAAESLRPPGSGGYSGNTYGSLWPWDYPANPINSDHPSSPYDGTNQGMAAFSSRGPTDDGRIKPDIMAPGTDILSCRSRIANPGNFWGLYANTNYAFMGGTSMSCPLTAGAAGLVRQFYAVYREHTNASAALVKATMLNGAQSITPGQYGTTLYREIPPPPRPNVVEGWGQVNMGQTLFPTNGRYLFGLDATNGLGTGEEMTFNVFVSAPRELRFTMAYSDYPGTAGGGKTLINDLDLRVTGPGGTHYYPNLYDGPDHTNNAESIDIAQPAAGMYTVRVSAYNTPEGPQAFAVVISGAIETAPRIEHTALQNQSSTTAPYAVTARITAPMPINTNDLRIYWNTDGSTNTFNECYMCRISNEVFRGYIPAHPLGTHLYYYISAATNGLPAVDPAGAPGVLHSFQITLPRTLDIQGQPTMQGHPQPPYGVHVLADGYMVTATVEQATQPVNSQRYRCTGWTGTGNVPPAGTANTAVFTLVTDSILRWQWSHQFGLSHTSMPAGIIRTTNWWNDNAAGQTITAPDPVTVAGSNYQFASWYVDHARWPDTTAQSPNPASGFLMYTARTCHALYLPAGQDLDGNGLDDWWEYKFFGNTGQDPDGDADSDTFSELLEFLDRTNPRDPSSFPHPPVFAHTPFDDPTITPAPWAVNTVITDNQAVAGASLWWQRNSGTWNSNALLAGTAENRYTNTIPAPGTNSDSFSYFFTAVDQAGLAGTSTVWSFDVRYARIAFTPARLTNIALLPLGSTTVYIQVVNDGLNLAEWDMAFAPAGFEDDMENATNGWHHSGANDEWHLQSYRSFSSNHAWYCGHNQYREYANSTDARLVTPEIGLGATPVLTFRHWAEFEYDADQMDNHYWDGSIVEITTNGGASFEQITPLGGYPGRITDNPASPFDPDTPCFGSTSGAWETVTFDLSNYAWQRVQMAFRFGSDAYVTYEGWYIDDVTVTRTGSTNAWVIFPVTNGIVSTPGSSNLAVTFSAALFNETNHWQGHIRLRTTDPFAPVNYLPVAMQLLPAVRLLVEGDPVRRGTPHPFAYGTNYLAPGRRVTNTVVTPVSPTDGVRYVCTGWSGGGAMPTNGNTNTVTYTATTNAELTWHWQTQYRLDVSATNGTVTGLPQPWQHENWIFDLLPLAHAGYLFNNWQKDGLPGGTTIPLSITANAPHTVSAGFTAGDWDVNATGTAVRTHWRIIDHAYGTFEVCNPADSSLRFRERFLYAITPHTHLQLKYPDGVSPDGLQYIDVTAQVESELLLTGNHDQIMDPGECVSIGEFEFLGKNPAYLTNWFFAKGIPDIAGNDTDHDRIPNDWEAQTGLDENNPADGGEDQDRDGIVSVQEFIADTDPFDRTSYLHIQVATPLSGNSGIQWMGGTAAVQYLDRADTFNGTWAPIFTNTPPTPVTNTILLPEQDTHGYYRIRAVR
jgi:subtilisin family serine protease